jgi:hypothetical protein
VLVSWNGLSEPLPCVHLDAQAQFDWLLLDYTGTRSGGDQTLRGQPCHVLSQRTECKGDIYNALAAHLHQTQQCPEYVALIDDDVALCISDINRALHIARSEGLDAFSPTLLHDSAFSHRWSLQRPNRLLREVDWIEVMMPFYRGSLFLSGREHYLGNISSYGIDRYLMPTLQHISGQTKTAVLDAVAASHRRPITSGEKVFRNGRTGREERSAMLERSLALLQAQRPDLIGSDWHHRIFVQRRQGSRWKQLVRGLGRPVRRWLDDST